MDYPYFNTLNKCFNINYIKEAYKKKKKKKNLKLNS